MAGGNHPKASSSKPSSSSTSSHRKSRWESNSNQSPAAQNLPAAAGEPKKLPPPPPPPKSYPPPKHNNNPPPKPSPSPSQQLGPIPRSGPGPSPSGAPFPFPDGPPPPPAYGFHMLDRRTIVLADGSARSYFALPHDYRDFAPPARFLPNNLELPGQGLGFDRQYPMSPELHGMRNPNHLKRKFGDEGERGKREEDEFSRQRQQLLQYGNAGSNPNAYPGSMMPGATSSSPYLRDNEMRATKYMRGDHVRHNIKHNEVDQVALKKAFLHFAKLVYENGSQKKNYLADGKQGPLHCVACGRSSKNFQNMHDLIIHTYNSETADLLVDHLGLHKVLCILMGWNYSMPPDNSKAYQLLSANEAVANQDDLIMWPPVVFIHNTMTGKGRNGHIEGLGNRAMDKKLRDLGFSGGKAKSLYGREGHKGITLVNYAGDESGLKEAVRLAEFFEKDNHGRRSWALAATKLDEENNPNLVRIDKSTGEKERILYGYLGTVSDFDRLDFETRKKVVIESRKEYKPLK